MFPLHDRHGREIESEKERSEFNIIECHEVEATKTAMNKINILCKLVNVDYRSTKHYSHDSQ